MTVLGAIMVLTLLAVGAAAQVRSQLRAAREEPNVAQVQMLVWSGLNEAARLARQDPANFGTTAPNPAAPQPAGWQPCTPEASPAGIGYVCFDLLQRRQDWVAFETSTYELAQVPVAVRWKLRASDTTKTDYGWVVLEVGYDMDGNVVWDPNRIWVYFYHQWCRPKEPPELYGAFCTQGG